MTTQPIEESGMVFGPFPDGHCFRIEHSTIYRNIQENVKIADFLLLKPKKGSHPTIWVVEAKSSSPRELSDTFINEIREKWVNALSLCLAACLKRHNAAEAELSKPFLSLNLSTIDVRFILVINGHKDRWLKPLNSELETALRPTIKTWAFSPPSVSVLVWNEHLAQKRGLIRTDA